MITIYRDIQKEFKIVDAYFLGLRCNFGAQTGGKIIPMSAPFKNIFIIEEYRFQQFRQLQRVNFWKFMESTKNTLKTMKFYLSNGFCSHFQSCYLLGLWFYMEYLYLYAKCGPLFQNYWSWSNIPKRFALPVNHLALGGLVGQGNRN